MKVLEYDGQHNIAGKRIKALRLSKRLTQEQVAARMQIAGIQINQKAISRLESGERVIPDYELLQLSKILGVSVDSLFEPADASSRTHPHG